MTILLITALIVLVGYLLQAIARLVEEANKEKGENDKLD